MAEFEVVDDPVPGETPDFVLTLRSGQRVALELTGLDDPDLHIGTQVMGHLEREIREAMPPLDVVIYMHTQYAGRVLLKDRRRRRELVDAVVQRLGAWNAGTGPDVFEDDGADDLPVITRLKFHRRDPGTGPSFLFGHHDGGSGSLFVRVVRERIAAKDEKAAACRARVPGAPLWLLLHGSAHANDPTIGEIVVDESYESEFDRVFVLDYFSAPHLHELKIARASSAP